MQKPLFFLGKWSGHGRVINKAGNITTFIEESTFEAVRPNRIFRYNQSTWTDTPDKKPMHAESGLIKILEEEADGTLTIEANFAHIFCLNEFETGSIKNGRLELEAMTPERFQRGPSAGGKKTVGVKREYWLNEDSELCYKMYLQIEGEEMYHHLDCCMKKTSDI